MSLFSLFTELFSFTSLGIDHPHRAPTVDIASAPTELSIVGSVMSILIPLAIITILVAGAYLNCNSISWNSTNLPPISPCNSLQQAEGKPESPISPPSLPSSALSPHSTLSPKIEVAIPRCLEFGSPPPLRLRQESRQQQLQSVRKASSRVTLVDPVVETAPVLVVPSHPHPRLTPRATGATTSKRSRKRPKRARQPAPIPSVVPTNAVSVVVPVAIPLTLASPVSAELTKPRLKRAVHFPEDEVTTKVKVVQRYIKQMEREMEAPRQAQPTPRLKSCLKNSSSCSTKTVRVKFAHSIYMPTEVFRYERYLPDPKGRTLAELPKGHVFKGGNHGFPSKKSFRRNSDGKMVMLRTSPYGYYLPTRRGRLGIIDNRVTILDKRDQTKRFATKHGKTKDLLRECEIEEELEAEYLAEALRMPTR
ncbi:hypothetical protein B0O99DRAFT_593881 [Bisporella sp. PMI_857]|nr:hypothetical protein B0O99DRAFT_593881 [Bisporella sp. PMI_857]